MAITNYSANRILDYNYGATSYAGTLPATMYVGLSTTTPAIDGTNVTEPVAMGYARVAITNNKTTWGNANAASLVNSIAVTFAISSGSWGTITHVLIYDALTSGNLWFFDALSPSRTVATSTIVTFDAGAITVSMSNS